MSNWMKFAFIFLLLVLIFELFIILPGKINEQAQQKDVKKVALEQPGSEQNMETVHLIESKNDKKEWELLADRAEGVLGQGAWKLKKIKVIFFTEEGATYTVYSDFGQLMSDTKDMKLYGSVLTKASNGYEYFGEDLEYKAQEKTLFTPNKIKMLGPKDADSRRISLRGEQMLIQLEKSLMIIEKNVNADREMQQGKVVSIRSNKAEFSAVNNMARFANRVKVFYDGMNISGPEAFFSYGPEKGDLPTELFVNGGVVVEDAKRRAHSDNLKIDFLTEEYTFKGSPKVEENGDVLTGQEIIFLQGGERVKVMGVKAEVLEEEQP